MCGWAPPGKRAPHLEAVPRELSAPARVQPAPERYPSVLLDLGLLVLVESGGVEGIGIISPELRETHRLQAKARQNETDWDRVSS